MTIEKALKTLIIKSPFYGLFLSGINKRVTESIDTMGVRIKGINVELLINQTFWDELKESEQIPLVLHECLHICFGHLTTFRELTDHNIANIAMDCEINQYIEGLPSDAVTLEKLNRDLGINMPAKAGTIEYYKTLLGYKDQLEDYGYGHDFGTGELTDQEAQLVENQVNHQMKETGQHVMKAIGAVPGELRDIIERLLNPKPPVFNWKAYFRRLIGSIISLELKRTYKKPNKRFEDAAGIKFKKKQKVLVCIDTSGSINNKDLTDFFSEIIHLYRAGAEIDILECDCKIGRVYPFNGIPDVNITGGGGTSCEPIADYIRARKGVYSACVYFTDGFLDTSPAEKLGLIWVISSDGKQDKFPGLTIKIPNL
jgi:predicted metal-dependent peptidase